MSKTSWQWIQTSGMDTLRLKQAMIDAAVAAGQLTEAGDGMYQTLEGHMVTVEDFATNLKDKWMTADVMEKGLATYGDFANRLAEVIEDLDFEGTTSDFISVLDDYKEGLIDVDEASKQLGVSSVGLKDILDELSSDEYDIGRHAFKMSQEAKTFAEAIDSVKDAVSTGWMTTFEMIFGNYEEAKKLWTGLANDLWEAFASGGAERNEILGFWKELGGRDSLIGGVIQMANLLVKPLSAIKAAFKSMFPDTEGMAQALYNMTKRFEELMDKLQPSEQFLKDVFMTFKGIFTIGKLVANIFLKVVQTILPITKPFGSLLELIIHFTGYIGAIIVTLADLVNETNIVQVAISVLAAAFSKLFEIIKTVGMIFGGGIAAGVGLFISLIGKAATAIQNFAKQSNIISRVIKTIGDAFQKIKSLFTGVKDATEGVTTVAKKMEQNFAGANTVIAETGTITRDTTQEFKHAMTPLEAFIKVLKTIRTVVGGAVLAVVAAVKTIASSIKNFFTDFINRFKQIDSTSKTFFDHIKAVFKTFGTYFTDLGGKIKEFFDGFGLNTDGIAATISKIGDAIKKLIGNIDTGKIAALAFAGAMIALVSSVVKLSKAVSDAVSSVTGVINTVNKVIKNKFLPKPNLINDLAKAFATIAASLALLTLVDQDKLKNVGDVMFKLIITFSACVVAIRGLDAVFGKFLGNLKGTALSTSIVSLAASFAILAGALFILSKVEIDEDWPKKLGIIGLMMLELVTAAALMSKLAPKLTKGSILLVALALAMKIMITAFKEITSEDLANVEENMVGFGLFFGAMSLMIAAAGKIKITSALSLLLVAKALQMIFPQMMAAISAIDGNGMFKGILLRVQLFFYSLRKFFEEMVETIGYIGTAIATAASIFAIIKVIGALAKLFTAIGSLGNLLKGVGVAAAGIGVAVILIAKAMEKFAEIKKTMSPEDFDQVAKVIGSFIIAIGACLAIVQLISVLSNVVGKKLLKWTDNIATNFVAVGVAFIAIGATMLLIAGALKIISTIKSEDLVETGVILGGLMLLLAAVAGAAGTIKSGMQVILAMVGVTTGLAILLAELAVLSIIVKNTDAGALAGAFVLLGLLTGALAGLFVAAGKVEKALPILAVLATIVGSVVVIGAALLVLKATPWEDLVGPVSAMGTLLGLLVLSVLILTKVNAQLSQVVGTIRLLLVVTVALAAIGAALYYLKGTPWEALWPTIAAMGLVFAELIVAVAILAKLSKSLTKQKSFLVGGLLAACVGAMAVAGFALYKLSGIPWSNLWPPLVAMSVVFGEMIGAVAILTLLSKKLTKQKTLLVGGLFAASILAMVAAGVALSKLSAIPWESLKAPLIAISGVMGSLLVTAGVLALIAKFMKGDQIIGAIGLIIAATASLVVVGLTLAALSQIPVEDLMQAAFALGAMMTAITAIVAILAVINTLVGAFAGLFGGGAAGFFALPALILAIGVALVAGAAAFYIAASAINTFAEGLGALYEPLQQLGTLDLAGIAGGLTLIGLASFVLGAGLAVFSLAGALGGAAFFVLAAGLNAFKTSGEEAVPVLTQLAAIDLKSIALGIVALGLSGVTLVIGAAGVYLFAKAIEVLVTALEKLNAAKSVGTFLDDLGTTFTTGSQKTATQALAAGLKTGLAFVLGFHNGAQWNSPPKFAVEFMKDLGYALGDNWELTRIADGSAVTIADAFTDSFKGGIEGLGDWFTGYMGGLFGQMGAIIYKFDASLKNFSGKQISQYGANGMPTYIQNMKYGGSVVGDYSDKLKEAWDSATVLGEGLLKDNYILDGLKETMEEATSGLGDIGDGFEEAGDKAGKAGKSVKDFAESLKDTLANQVDMFSKFEIKTGVTADQMIENMKSNIDGFASWSHRMTVLAERFAQHGIADTLYEQLAELGPKGYETMNAFYEMTDDQLEQVRDLWATGLTLPEGQAGIVASGYQYMGEMATKGFSDALNDHKSAHEAAHGLGKAALDGLKEVLEVHSPSKATEQIGDYLVEGLAEGIDSVHGEGILYFAVKHVCDHILELFNENLNAETIGVIGDSILTNIFTNVMGTIDVNNPIITAFVNGIRQLDPVMEALQEFVDAVIEKLNEAFMMDDSTSPSTLFFQYGQNSILGYANGIQTNVGFIRFAITVMTTAALSKLNSMNLPSKFYEYGKNATLGFANGLADEEATRRVYAKAEEIARTAAAKMKEGLNESSPSRVTMQIGRYASEGLAIGIEQGAETVYKAAESVTDGAIESMSDNTGRLQDLLNNKIDLNPVITPMLDLSLIREQMAELNALMNNPGYAAYGQNGGQFTGNVEGTAQINFTQNNYSPKELSRYDIYRNTKNQINMMKGVIAHA